MKAFLAYDKNAQQDEVERVYDLYAKPQAFERVPYVLAPAVKSVIDQQPDPDIAAQMKAYDFHMVIDNSIVDRLVKQGILRAACLDPALRRKSSVQGFTRKDGKARSSV